MIAPGRSEPPGGPEPDGMIFDASALTLPAPLQAPHAIIAGQMCVSAKHPCARVTARDGSSPIDQRSGDR